MNNFIDANFIRRYKFLDANFLFEFEAKSFSLLKFFFWSHFLKRYVAPLRREFPGAESVLFKEKFANWGTSLPINTQPVNIKSTAVANVKEQSIDVMSLHKKKAVPEEVMIDEGNECVLIISQQKARVVEY